MMKRKIIMFTVLLLAASLVFSACGTDNTLTDAGATSDAASSSGASDTALEPPGKIRFFYVTSGISTPEDMDFKNNVILDEISKMANVEITEVIVPPWSDIVTQFNLMMASGNICDVVHYNLPTDLISNGKLGAFIELSDIIKNSEILSERYSPYMEQIKADDNNIYCIRSLPSDGDVNNAFGVRYDLLKDIGYTKIPETMDGWIDAMRKLKAKYPDSIPYTSRENLHWCEFVFSSYGCSGWGYKWQYYNGKMIHPFEHPLYKEAIKTYNLMLKEELMDREFVTSKNQDFQDKRLNKKVLINQQNAGGLSSWIYRFATVGIDEAIIIPAQWPKIDDPLLDPRSVYEGQLPLGTHSMAIASSSQNKDAAARFIEALLSDKCKELTIWGREGIEFNIADGKKVIDIEKSAQTEWRELYGAMFGGSRESLELWVQIAIENTKLDSAQKQEYKKLYWEQFNKVYADANSVPINPMKFIILEADTDSRRIEAENEARTITVKAMLEEISLEEFDVQAANFIKRYQDITDEYNIKLPEAIKKAEKASTR